MNTLRKIYLLSVIILLSHPLCSQTNKDIPYDYIGKIKPRHAREIQSSRISIGAEYMDRDYTIYSNWKEFLGPLGAKKARIQSGWAKCEKEKGVYNFAWLDEIIFDMTEQGVTPWVNLSYGNAIYEGGGGWTLGQDWPSSGEAIEGWKRFVTAIVTRYKDYVNEWEIWNEPNRSMPVEFGQFSAITAKTIKEAQPEAIVIGIALNSGIFPEFADKVLAEIENQNAIHLIDQVAHHRNIEIPEQNEPEIELERVVDKYSPHIVTRQGEAGCPSRYSEEYALRRMDWTEIQQAKNTLRRLMCDLGRDKETSIFTIIDACNTRRGWNYKGLLASNPNNIEAELAIKDPQNLTVDYPKPAYYAMQHVTSIFDFTLEPLSFFPYEVDHEENLYLFPHQNIHSGKQAIALWYGNIKSTTSTEKQSNNLKIYNGNFDEPVWVDLLSGEVFEIPRQYWSKKGTVYSFNNIPIYDSPILIINKSLILLKE